MIVIARAYDSPAQSHGKRFLVDRLWPRGVAKTHLPLTGWLKDAAPSDNLRHWFQHDPAKWDEFRKRYFEELDANHDALKPLLEAARQGDVTLVYAAKDEEHNNAAALREYLSRYTG